MKIFLYYYRPIVGPASRGHHYSWLHDSAEGRVTWRNVIHSEGPLDFIDGQFPESQFPGRTVVLVEVNGAGEEIRRIHY